MRLHCRLIFWNIVWTCVGILVVTLIVLTFNSSQPSLGPDANISNHEVQYEKEKERLQRERSESSTLSVHSEDSYLIDTSGCRIPNPATNQSSLRDIVKQIEPFACRPGRNHGLTYVGANRTLVVDTSVLFVELEDASNRLSDFYCCLWNMYRSFEQEDDSVLGFPPNCIRFRWSIEAKSDYVKVDCYVNKERVYETFHVIPMRHQKVEERCSRVLQQEQRDASTTNNAANHCIKNEERLSVLILILDSMSRLSIHRHLPDSYRYLVDDLGAIELNAYARVGENTFPNFVSLMKGVSENQLRDTCWPNDQSYFDNCSFLWNEFSAAGYRTAFVEDQPDIGLFHFEKRGFRRQPTDYYGHPFFSEVFKVTRFQNDCLNDKMETEYLLQWAFDLKSLFARGERFFGVFFASRYTHVKNVNKIQYVEKPLLNHLRQMKTSGQLDDTLLIVMGDHGQRFGGFRETEIGNYEVNLPASFLIFPPDFRRRYSRLVNNVRHNARQRLTTHFDVHQLLKDILNCAYNDQSRFQDCESSGPTTEPNVPHPLPRGISLFDCIPARRTCTDAGIATEFCPCQRSNIPLDVASPIARAASDAVIQQINKRTKPVRELCAQFTLDRIIRVNAIEMSNPQLDQGRLIYEVSLQVRPGGGRFQGTVVKYETQTMATLKDDQEEWKRDPDLYWTTIADKLYWHKKWDQLKDTSDITSVKWFVGGLININYNLLDIPIQQGFGDTVIIIHESYHTNCIETFTYSQVLNQVSRIAGYLHSLGVGVGDYVLINMPMIPEGLFAIQACVRIGAPYNVIQKGYNTEILQQLIDALKPKVIFTANIGFQETELIQMKKIVDEALEVSTHQPIKCIVLQRPQWEQAKLISNRDIDFNVARDSAGPKECVPVESNSPMFIMHTSGSIGKPKAIIHGHGPFGIRLWNNQRNFRVQEGEVILPISQFGWISGNLIYARAFMMKTPVIILEGPMIRPDIRGIYKILVRHKVDTIVITGNFFHYLNKMDESGEIAKQYGPYKLKLVIVSGSLLRKQDETHFRSLVKGVSIFHGYGQTETGSRCTGYEINKNWRPISVNNKSVGKLLPGFDVKIVGENGIELPTGDIGQILFKLPLPPGSPIGIHDEPNSFKEHYCSTFPGFYDTGDCGAMGKDGNLYFFERSDFVFKFGKTMFSTGAIEEIMLLHAEILECVVVLKTVTDCQEKIPVAFYRVKDSCKTSATEMTRKLLEDMKNNFGSGFLANDFYRVNAFPTGMTKISKGMIQYLVNNRKTLTEPPNADLPGILDIWNILQ